MQSFAGDFATLNSFPLFIPSVSEMKTSDSASAMTAVETGAEADLDCLDRLIYRTCLAPLYSTMMSNFSLQSFTGTLHTRILLRLTAHVLAAWALFHWAISTIDINGPPQIDRLNSSLRTRSC